MKIGIVQVALSHGGAEMVGVMLANGFYRHEHVVYILTDLNEQKVYDTDQGINIIDFAGKKTSTICKWLKAIKNIRCFVKKEQPNVLIGIMGLCTLITYIACIGLHIPIIMTEHNAFERPASAPMPLSVKFFKFWINKIYKHITVLTEADKKVIGNRLRNVTVMPNPLLLKPIKEIPAKEKIVLAAGRVDAWHVKGFDVLIKSWKKIKDLNDSINDDDDLREWWLKIAGAGKQESFEYLMNLLPDGNWIHNDNDNSKDWLWRSKKYHIEFLGFQKDMESLYQKSEIFVLSSRYEGFGLVLIEAMSQGCAPIACDFKGRQKEILCPEGISCSKSQDSSIEICENGILCEPDNVEVLAKALEKMMDEEYRKQAQLKSVERSKYYSLDNCVNRWEEYLSQIKG